MGVNFSAVQRTAIEKFTSSVPTPAGEIQATVFDPLGQIRWRRVDFSCRDSRDALDTMMVHSAETHNVPQLFGYVARLMDGVSAAAAAGSLLQSSPAGAAPGAVTPAASASKENTALLDRATQLTRLASVLLFNAIQQCAGNPFALLRLTNSPNEEAMSMLGAAAELLVRVPFTTATAPLHVEATELLRFSFATRLYGTSLTAAAGEAGVGGSILPVPSSSAASASPDGGGKARGSAMEDGAAAGEEAVVRDPFLRRLALGQRDALLTKALVHALLQRICIWASVLRSNAQTAVWIEHQQASAASATAGGVLRDPAPHITAASAAAASAASSAASSASSSSSSWGSSVYGWIFGGGGSGAAATPASSSSAQQFPAAAEQLSSGGAPYPTAGRTAAASSAETIVGAASLHVLLCLLLFDRGAASGGGKQRNAAVDVIRQLRGIDEFGGGIESSSSSTAAPSASHHRPSAGAAAAAAAAAAAPSASPSSSSVSYMISPILGGEWPLELVEALAALIPTHLEASVLLYCLLNDCHSFTRSLARYSSGSGSSRGAALYSQLAHLMVDLIRPAVERPSSPESLFLAVVAALLCRVDGVARAMFAERLRAVPDYFVKETSSHLTTALSVGSFVVLAMSRIVFRASMSDGQAAVGAAWLSAFVNLSPFAADLDTAVEQKLVMLFLALLRRVHRLRAETRANEHAFFAAAQLDTAYAHLEIIATGIFQMVADPQRNPTLLYELLYHRDKISAVTASWVEGDAVWRALRPIAFILDRIEAEMSSMRDKPRSIPGILAVIRSVGRGLAAGAAAPEPGAAGPEQSRVRITLKQQQPQQHAAGEHFGGGGSIAAAGGAAGLYFPKVTVMGADEEVVVTTYDFLEEGSCNEGGDGENAGHSMGSGVSEPFFATLLWHAILATDAKVEPPGCLRVSLGIHAEAFPIFSTKLGRR